MITKLPTLDTEINDKIMSQLRGFCAIEGSLTPNFGSLNAVSTIKSSYTMEFSKVHFQTFLISGKNS